MTDHQTNDTTTDAPHVLPNGQKAGDAARIARLLGALERADRALTAPEAARRASLHEAWARSALRGLAAAGTVSTHDLLLCTGGRALHFWLIARGPAILPPSPGHDGRPVRGKATKRPPGTPSPEAQVRAEYEPIFGPEATWSPEVRDAAASRMRDLAGIPHRLGTAQGTASRWLAGLARARTDGAASGRR